MERQPSSRDIAADRFPDIHFYFLHLFTSLSDKSSLSVLVKARRSVVVVVRYLYTWRPPCLCCPLQFQGAILVQELTKTEIEKKNHYY